MHLPDRPLALMVAGPLHRIRPRYSEIGGLLMQLSRKTARALGVKVPPKGTRAQS